MRIQKRAPELTVEEKKPIAKAAHSRGSPDRGNKTYC